MKKATRFDVVDYLDSNEAIIEYINAALEEGDSTLIAAALGDVARAKGMTQLSRETGVSRDGLYKALSPTGNPSISTFQSVISALGLQMVVKPIEKA